LWVDAGVFPSVTYGGTTAKSVIWHGLWPLAGGWFNEGEISSFSIRGNSLVGELIRTQGVVHAMYKDLLLDAANYGIYGTGNGWGSCFENIRVENQVIGSIGLDSFYNGCTFLNCVLYGKDLPAPGTQVHFRLEGGSFGCLFSGGYIEKCLAGVRLKDAQCNFIGNDFELCSYSFIETEGSFVGPSLDFAGPPSVIEGNTFVGAPSNFGIVTNGSPLQVSTNFFVTNGAPVSPTTYAIKGLAGGDATIAGFPNLAISEFNNTQRGWDNNFIDPASNIGTREWANVTKVGTYDILQTGVTSAIPLVTVPWKFRATGKTWVNGYFGYGINVNVGVDQQIFEITGLGSVDTSTTYGFDSYVANYYNVKTVAIKGIGNLQSATDTYGKLVLGAYVTNATTTTQTREVLVDTITASFRPGVDNSTKLGSASFRWSEVFAGNGTINTSDANEKQQIRSLSDQERSVAVELKAAIKAFKFNDAVATKGNGARIHVGVIAQEVEQIFINNGLNPVHYGVFCRDTWYTLNGEVVLVDENKKATKVTWLLNNKPVEPDENGKFPEGATKIEEKVDTKEHSLLGIRYDELFAFIFSAL
jgi:hypothetical protein